MIRGEVINCPDQLWLWCNNICLTHIDWSPFHWTQLLMMLSHTDKEGSHFNIYWFIMFFSRLWRLVSICSNVGVASVPGLSWPQCWCVCCLSTSVMWQYQSGPAVHDSDTQRHLPGKLDNIDSRHYLCLHTCIFSKYMCLKYECLSLKLKVVFRMPFVSSLICGNSATASVLPPFYLYSNEAHVCMSDPHKSQNFNT